MPEENYPFVSIIFPNWNGKNDVFDCLNSLRKLDYPKDKLEIIICDNGSTDGSQEAIKQRFSTMANEGWFALKLIEIKRNIGPSLARNKGTAASEENFSYIWMIDNDIVVDIKAINEMLKISEISGKIGILGSVNYDFNNPNKMTLSGGMIDWSTLTMKNINEKMVTK